MTLPNFTLICAMARENAPNERDGLMSLPAFALCPSVSLPTAESLKQTLVAYVAQEAPNLTASYTSTVDEMGLEKHLGLHVIGDSAFARNLDLRHKLAALWASAPERHLQIAAYRARFWGGAPATSPDRVASFVATIETGERPTYEGIAAWSRIASAANPHESAIFNGRISFSLNALQLLSGAANAVMFPKLPCRDSLIKRVSGLLCRTRKSRAWERLPQEEVFPAYLQLLRMCALTLSGPLPMAQAEMVLFAMAKDLARRAEIKLSGGPSGLPNDNS
ncbi:hypothetical protein [uncultured Variovorax sp.]|uniref:hypothetical protein n=1 Tax=uncultured Variovorax sp. TaxID=114708 RepID=UPI0025E2752B|nr:hypothetical protein [uncultured Variovorax sp.]